MAFDVHLHLSLPRSCISGRRASRVGDVSCPTSSLIQWLFKNCCKFADDPDRSIKHARPALQTPTTAYPNGYLGEMCFTKQPACEQYLDAQSGTTTVSGTCGLVRTISIVIIVVPPRFASCACVHGFPRLATSWSGLERSSIKI